ncbi:MAG: hypothetical protein FWG90_14175, partial [Oscillospiraceae bacterium]|nr:hypothetical protein [Oscillospiraceae bacterium]
MNQSEQWSGFFNSLQGDRKYSADDWAAFVAAFVGNGVYAEPANNLQIVSGAAIGQPEVVNGNYTIYALPGIAFINGYVYYNKRETAIPIIYNEVFEVRNNPRI